MTNATDELVTRIGLYSDRMRRDAEILSARGVERRIVIRTN